MRKSFIITNLRDLSKTHEERSNFKIDKQMKRILKNYRRKRREPYAMGLGNDLSFHLIFL